MADTVVIKADSEEPQKIFRANGSAITFQVTTQSGEAVLTLIQKESPHKELIVVQFGSHSAILSLVKQSVLFSKSTPELMMVPNEPSNLWLSWYNKNIKLGLVGSSTPVIKLEMPQDQELLNAIGYVKFHTKSAHDFVEWKFDAPPDLIKEVTMKRIDKGSLKWVPKPMGELLPTDALVGGFEDELIYVARANHNGSLTPGKYVPSKNAAFVAWGHMEHRKSEFEILCGFNVEWVKTRANYIPQNAVVGGYSEVASEPLYIGRNWVSDNLICGKVHTLYSSCYLPSNGKEVEVHTYEILVSRENPERGISLEHDGL